MAAGWLASEKEAACYDRAPIHARPPGQNHLLAQVPRAEYEQFLP